MFVVFFFFPNKCLRKNPSKQKRCLGKSCFKSQTQQSCNELQDSETSTNASSKASGDYEQSWLKSAHRPEPQHVFSRTWRPPLKQAMPTDDHSPTEAPRDYVFLVQPAVTRDNNTHKKKKAELKLPAEKMVQGVRWHLRPSIAAGSQNCFKP